MKGLEPSPPKRPPSTREVGHAYATLHRSGRGFRFIARPGFSSIQHVMQSAAKYLAHDSNSIVRVVAREMLRYALHDVLQVNFLNVRQR